jgi:Zinc finger, C2H2 type
LKISDDENVKICEECFFVLEDIKSVVTKSQRVQQMFETLQEKELTESLSSDDLNKFRLEFGFAENFEDITEVYLDEDTKFAQASYVKEETDEIEEDGFGYFEEVVYEELDSPSTLDELELENGEHVEFEIKQETAVEIAKELNDKFSFNYVCHICQQTFDKMYELSNHTREAHQTLPKVECSCGRYLSTWDSLMAHKRKHSPGENPFSCDLCSLSFRTKTGLSIHIKFKHEKPVKLNACNICKKHFKENSSLKNHMRTHLSDAEKFAFECSICGKKVVNKYSLKYHIQTIHEGRKQHFCHLCGRGFGNKSNLRSHLISHTTENVSCTVCGGKFKNRISLQSHMKLHKDQARVFPCRICDKTFYNRNHLTRHMAAHTEEKSFKCKYPNCSSEYKWEKDLKNHVVGVHSGENFSLVDEC